MSDRIDPSTMVPTYGAGRIIMIFFVFITFLLPAMLRNARRAGMKVMKPNPLAAE